MTVMICYPQISPSLYQVLQTDRETDRLGFGVTGICIIITKPRRSTGRHNVIEILAKFLLQFVSTMDMLEGNRGR